MKTNVYVDGFNFYYGCIKDTPYRWLNLLKLCQYQFPSNTIHRIRYFTAYVKPRPGDLQQPVRQQAYLRALNTLPNLTIHAGEFLSHAVQMRLVKAASKSIIIDEQGLKASLFPAVLTDANGTITKPPGW